MKIELSRLLSTPFMAVNEEDENEVVFCLTDMDGELPEGFYDDNEEYAEEEDEYEIISEYGTLWRKLCVFQIDLVSLKGSQAINA